MNAEIHPVAGVNMDVSKRTVGNLGAIFCYAAIEGVVMEFKDIVGKTIRAATHVKRPATDDEGWLLLEFTDGSKCIVYSWYGGYTGDSEDEYPTGISISDKTDGFVPVEPSA